MLLSFSSSLPIFGRPLHPHRLSSRQQVLNAIFFENHSKHACSNHNSTPVGVAIATVLFPIVLSSFTLHPALVAAQPLKSLPSGSHLHSTSSKQYRRLFDEAWAPIYILFYPRDGLQFTRDDWLDLRKSVLSSDAPFTSRARARDIIREALATLGDPYTAYLTPAEFNEEIRGSGWSAGVGLRLGGEGGVHVVAPLPESPAERAGIGPGDSIISVDGISVANAHLTPKETVEMTRGTEGTSVTLQIIKKRPHRPRSWSIFAKEKDEESNTPRTLQLIRKRLFTEPVRSTRIGDIGFIRIHFFSDRAKDAVAESLTSFASQGVFNIVLDVRNCLGGVFQDALHIASMFLRDCPSCNIVTTVDGNGIRADHLVSTNQDGTFVGDKQFNVAILVNAGSASSSEVLAVGLRGNNRARLVGETTYGKGLVQHYFPLSDGGAIRATIGEYLQPSGATVQKDGVQPDIMCHEPIGSEPSNDICVQRAIEALSGFRR